VGSRARWWLILHRHGTGDVYGDAGGAVSPARRQRCRRVTLYFIEYVLLVGGGALAVLVWRL